jgi:hypothetical protein
MYIDIAVIAGGLTAAGIVIALFFWAISQAKP